MSLATRCTHCNTAFKVVQDQLKVSQGWVRCGHCNQVFNALEEMFDTEQDSVWSPSMLSGDFAIEDEQAPATAAPAAATNTAIPSRQDDDDAFELEFPNAQPDTTPAPEPAPAPEPEPAEAPATPELPAAPAEPAKPVWSNLMAPADPGVLERSLPPPSQRRGRPGTRGRAPSRKQAAPGFVKQAEKQAVWRHPLMRATLSLLALVLLALLAMQAMHHWRNTLAAHYPTTKPLLEHWCSAAGCRIDAPMDLEALSVDSITVVKTDSLGDDRYQLTVIIQNRADIDLQWPMLDITLTNSSGEVLTRRNLSASTALQVPVTDDHNRSPTTSWAVSPTAQPGATALQWQLRAPDLQLSSYTAELFYP